MKFVIIAIFWIMSLAVTFVVARKSDQSADRSLPKEFDEFRRLYRESTDSGLSWLSDPLCRVFGSFIVMRPEDNKTPGLYVALPGKQPFPTVLFVPSIEDDKVERIELRDKIGNTVSVADKDHDGIFDFLFLESGDSLRMDKGLSGTWNHIQDRNKK